jgi:hypothetical protein
VRVKGRPQGPPRRSGLEDRLKDDDQTDHCKYGPHDAHLILLLPVLASIDTPRCAQITRTVFTRPRLVAKEWG